MDFATVAAADLAKQLRKFYTEVKTKMPDDFS